jgi:hypothetical protein
MLNTHPLADAHFARGNSDAPAPASNNQVPRSVGWVATQPPDDAAMYACVARHVANLAPWERPADGLPGVVGLQVHAAEGEVSVVVLAIMVRRCRGK